jgi:single-stranded-DNA-specific exonuclease
MKKNWVIKELKTNYEVHPNYPEFISRLLALRGVVGLQNMEEFLNPDYARMQDPFLFRGMKPACERIWQAIEKGENVAIYADYDADAITALSIMHLGLKKLGLIVSHYIPDRFTEGYGMNTDAIKALKAKDISLIISVDCGTNSVAEAALCKELGMDLIITDHHEQTGPVPDVLELINPKAPREEYPSKQLTGAGVAFKLMQGMFSYAEKVRMRGAEPGWEKWLMDLAAIGTVADCQDLSGENRLIVKYGLVVMVKTRWPGLSALIEQAQIARLDTYAIGFMIAPRINAAGRIRHGELAYRLLVSENYQEAQDLAMELDELNRHRQSLTDQILSEAKEQAMHRMSDKVMVVSGENWPKGIVGLVAGRLAEELNRPVLVIDRGGEFATGSARSIEAFDVVEALKECSGLLVRFGGHKQAAGFTLLSKNIQKFHLAVLEYADKIIDELPAPVLPIDLEMDSKDLTLENYAFLEKLSPFGAGNPKPLFFSRNFEVLSSGLVGSAERKHAKIRVQGKGGVFDAIAFNQPHLAEIAQKNRFVDAVYEPIPNDWNGITKLDLKIIDIKPHGSI